MKAARGMVVRVTRGSAVKKSKIIAAAVAGVTVLGVAVGAAMRAAARALTPGPNEDGR